MTGVQCDQSRRLVKEDGVRVKHKLFEGFEAITIALVDDVSTVAWREHSWLLQNTVQWQGHHAEQNLQTLWEVIKFIISTQESTIAAMVFLITVEWVEI